MWEILKRLVKKEKREDKGIKIRERKVEKSDEETLLRKSIRDLERREVESVDTSLLSKGYKIDYSSLPSLYLIVIPFTVETLSITIEPSSPIISDGVFSSVIFE